MRRLVGLFWLVFLAWPVDATLPAPSGPARFAHLGVEEGLPDSQVHTFLHDRQGFLWIGTRDGLARFDGYRFTVYRHDPTDPGSMGGSWVSSLKEDHDGNIWVILGVGGVDRFDRTTERFFHVGRPKADGQLGLGDSINDALVDHTGDVWFGTATAGLFCWRRQSGVVEFFEVSDGGQNTGQQHAILKLFEDSEGRLWVGTDGGLFRVLRQERRTEPVIVEETPSTYTVTALAEGPAGDLWIGTDQGLWRMKADDSNDSRWFGATFGDDLPTGRVSHLTLGPSGRVWVVTSGDGLSSLDVGAEHFIPHPVGGPEGPSSHRITSQLIDSRGHLWLGTIDAGLDRFRPEVGRFESHRVTPGDPHGLGTDCIITLYEDRDGGLWVGTAGGGAFLFAPWRWKFRSYRHEIAEALGKPPHPMYAQVTALAEGAAGKVWVGTPSGLLTLDQFTDHWRVHRQGPGAEGEPPKESVSALVVDETGTLWIGTPSSGLRGLLPEGEGRRVFRHEPGSVESLSSDGIQTLALGSKSTLWVGTQARGFNRLDLKSGRVERFPGIIPGLWQPGIWALLEDSRGYLWLGTPSFALHRFDPRSGEFVTYPWRAGDPKSLNNRTISSLFEDSQGRFWVGTFSGGLSLLNRESDTFKAFTIHQGLPSNMVQGILEDEGGDLWLATNGGIARFDPASGAVRAYDRRDGLQHDEFALGVVLKTGEGEVFLGGRGGLTRFRPADLADNPLAPPVILTSLRVLGEERRVGWDLSVPERVDFAHDENVLQIEFAALDYTDPQKNRYAWKLEGFDHRWVENIAGRVATYTNLDPGEYLFRVKGSNSDGVWSAEEASLRIRILPPFWRTWWFQTLEALGALGLLTLGFVWQRRLLDQQKRREIRRRDLQRKTEELEVARHLQLSMLPPPDFASANFEGVGRMVTATEVGGDYFDFLDLADGVSCLAIGDAIGHGTAAGLVVGMAKAALIQALALTQGVRPSPEELLLGLGKTLQKAVQGRTAGLGLCLVVLDDVTRSAEVCSVAMPYPYHYSAAEKRLRSLELGGFPLGRCGAEHLRSVRLELEPGDALILLSDGFPERLDPEDDQWGYEELNDVLAALCQGTTSPKDLTARLFAACDAFGRGREPEDDMTAVVVFCRG